MKSLRIITIVLLAGVIVSCSGYNAVSKSDDYDKKQQLANEYYEEGSLPKIKRSGKKKYKTGLLTRSVALYEQIYQRKQKAPEGEVAYFKIGKAYYLIEDYYMAGYYLGMFAQRFPYSPKAEESMFLSAMCSLQNSPEWSLDQNETEMAISNLQQFIDRYPSSFLVDSCNHIIDQLHFKLERKSYESVKLYARTSNFAAVVSASMTFIEDFPMSEFEEEVYFLLTKNSYLLAKNSVESKKRERVEQTIERYSNFVAKFPTSKYLNELEGYNKTMSETLHLIKETNSVK